MNFIDTVISGESDLRDIDCWIEMWHTDDHAATTLPSFLGMTDEEYASWVKDPDVLESIIEAHKPKRRTPDVVIDQMLVHIPASMGELIDELNRVKETACYTAPECWGEIWSMMAYALQKVLPYPPKEDWQKEVYKIITQKEPPEV